MVRRFVVVLPVRAAAVAGSTLGAMLMSASWQGCPSLFSG
jgi:hypothetical protein